MSRPPRQTSILSNPMIACIGGGVLVALIVFIVQEAADWGETPDNAGLYILVGALIGGVIGWMQRRT